MNETNTPEIRLKDSDTVKHVIVEFDIKQNSTKIMSAFTVWGNIQLLASAIGMSYNSLIKNGADPKQTYARLEEIIIEMLSTDYSFIEVNEKETETTEKSRRTSGNKKTTGKGRGRSISSKKADKSKPRTNGNNKQTKKQSKKTG